MNIEYRTRNLDCRSTTLDVGHSIFIILFYLIFSTSHLLIFLSSLFCWSVGRPLSRTLSSRPVRLRSEPALSKSERDMLCFAFFANHESTQFLTLNLTDWHGFPTSMFCIPCSLFDILFSLTAYYTIKLSNNQTKKLSNRRLRRLRRFLSF